MKKSVFKLLLFVGAFSAVSFQLFAGKEAPSYKYEIDLSNVSDDKLAVSVSVPKIKLNEINFYLPKIIPGTYSIADYGRFVSNFKAFDKKGNELLVDQLDDNTWTIKSAKKLKKISYIIDDTFDSTVEGPKIFEPAGSNIEENKNFVINPSGYFGYLEGMKNMGFEISITRPESFYGATGLKALSQTSTSVGNFTDLYKVPNYDKLVDSPMMYSLPDTSIVNVAGTEVLIASYSPNKMVTAKQISETIKEILFAQREYLGGKLPVDKYAFIFYFTDQPITAYGALEHSYSSFYYMPERPIATMAQQLRDFAAHEFFHIVTPLTVHSQEIHRFDFNNPKMSKHLWMYEGVTEYFAGNVQVKYDLITPEQYLQILRQKMVYSSRAYNDTLSFTDLSKYTLDKYSDQYGNVYQKGALIGLCLDLKLRKLSEGKYGLQDLMAQLSTKYGSEKAFNDEALFAEITQMTYPEIGAFFQDHVEGNKALPLGEILSMAGVNYLAAENFSDYSLGFGQQNLGFNPETSQLFIQKVNTLDIFGSALGFEEGDVLKRINGDELPPIGPELGQFIGGKRSTMEEGKDFAYTVLRKAEDGTETEVELVAPVVKVEQQRLHQIAFAEDATEEQRALRKAWLRP